MFRVETARSNLVEACRLEALVFAGAARHAHEPDLEVRRVLEHPDLVPFLGLDHARRRLGEARRQAAREGVRRLHDVVVHRDHRVLHRPRLRVGQQRRRHRTFDTEFDHACHARKIAPLFGTRQGRRVQRV